MSEAHNKRGNSIKEKIFKNISANNNSSMKSTGRSGNRAWALNGNNINKNELPGVKKMMDSSMDLSYSNNPEVSNRNPSKRVSSLGRSESSMRSSKNKLPLEKLTPANIGPDYTIIHVIDENKNKEKDFKCSLKILLKHMKYFEKHLNSPDASEDIDISVH